MKFIPFSIVMLLTVVHVPVSLRAQDLTPEGVWLHDNELIQVKIAPCDDQREEPLYGKIFWLEYPDDEEGEPRLDTENPDQALRDQLVIGTNVIHDSFAAAHVYGPTARFTIPMTARPIAPASQWWTPAHCIFVSM